ncbi:MAG: outer membrane protein transport protein [Deltaproteobacteria bacterium]|nr:outer membrane protein transport protein [Deltaproteobacteria bacterium]
MRLTLLVALSLAARTAFAGAALPAEIEVVGQSLGGATIASPETLGAAWYNPAALAGQSGLRLQLEGGVQYSPVVFERAQDVHRYPPAPNLAPFNPAFFGALSYDFGVENLSVCVAVYSPVAGHYAYAERGPQRYSLVAADHFMLTIHAGVAYKVSIFSFGVMLGDTMVGSSLKTTISGALAGDIEDPAFAIPVSVSLFDAFSPSFNFGVRVEPSPWLAFGASFQPPYDATLFGTAQITMPDALAFIVPEGDRVRVDMKMPFTLRIGAKARPLPWLALDAAFVMQGFSSYKELRVQPEIRVLDQPLPEIVLDKSFRDTYSARLGIEARPFQWLALRAGVAYESTGVRPEVFDLGAPDANKVWLTAGAGVRFGIVSVDVSYMHMFAPAVVTNSSRVSVGPLVDFSSAEPRIIGNGVYRFGMEVFHLGVGIVLFERPR